jgi:serpin B
MGMTAPFGDADLGGISKERNVFTGDAIHRANMTVDAKGTEAAATALDMPVSATPEPVEITANRPFFFAITERGTGTVLFFGRVTDPE